MPSITANGIEMYYEERGSGVPVLFIHGGFGGAESTLYPQPYAFHGILPEERFRVICYDRRNAGRSQYVTEAFALEDLAADARELQRALGIERAIVVGDSLGGMIAQQMAIDHSDAIHSLVLMETGTQVLKRTKQVSAVLLALRVLGPRVLFRRFKHRFLNPDWSKPVGPPKPDEELRRLALRHEELRATLRDLPEEELYRLSLGLIRTYVAYSGRDTSLKMYGVRVPVHVLHGMEDRIVSLEKGRALHARIPNARLIELPGLDHGLLYYDEARRVLRDVIERHAAELASAAPSLAASPER